MGFTLGFEEKCPFRDPEFGPLDMIIKGEATVSDPNDTNEERAKEHAKLVIRNAVFEALDRIESESISYTDISARSSEIEDHIGNSASARALVCNGVRITEISPSERSLNYIRDLSKMKAFSQMSPEELAKKSEEAQKAAMEAVAKMTPEERKKAEEEAQRMMCEFEEKQKALMDDVHRIMNGSGPKFCPDCGAPVKGAKFCSNCGKKLS